MMTGNIFVTFILAIANSEQIIQISDCSVVLNGRIEDEKFNKAGHLLCDDASVLYGFTGLATVDNHENIQHDVQDWILDALDIAVARAFESSGQTGYFIGEIEAEFAYVATLHFRHAMFLEGIKEEDRRLTFMLTGYKSDGTLIHTIISNCLDRTSAQAEFKIATLTLRCPSVGEPVLIQSIGRIGQLSTTEESEIRGLLERKAPAESIHDHTATIVTNRLKVGGADGRRIATAILRREEPDLPILEYKFNEAGDTRAFLDFVSCKKGQKVKLSKNAFGDRSDGKGHSLEGHEALFQEDMVNLSG
jgi:hypothetical protein